MSANNSMNAEDRKKYDIESRKAFLLLDKDDEKRMKNLKPLAEENAGEMMEGLYEHFKRYDTTKKFLQSDKHIENLKKAQDAFFMQLVDGNYDDSYMESRVSVGRTHERIGLEPRWYIGAYARYMNLLLPYMFEHFKGKPKALEEHISSVVKLIFLDMSYAIETYIDAMQQREDDLKKTFIESLDEFSEALESSTTNISSTVAEQSASAQQQAASIAEVTTSVSELKQTSAQSQENAEKVIAAAQGSVEVSAKGTQAVEQSISGMHDIQKQVEAIAEKILNLSEQTQQIGEIIQSVNEISEQSKLLALNASIEAARAGEHGRGFSVVASEIRTLADQSKQATTQVRAILGDIQKATNSAVIATEEGSKKVDSGVDLANLAGQNIHNLAQSIQESSDAGRLISASANQQTAGIEQVASAMAQINQATQDTTGALKNTEEAAEAMRTLSTQMGDLIERFSNNDAREVEWLLA